MGFARPTGPAASVSVPATAGASRRWGLGGNVQPSTSFFMIYFAAGLLLAEAAGGLVLFTEGGALLRGSGSSTPAAPQIPNGVPVFFNLTAYMTGFIGSGGPISGVRDPTLTVGWGDYVTVTVTDGEANIHNFHIDGANLQTPDLTHLGDSASVHFQATQEGSFAYYCAIPGHRQAGMAGTLVVGEPSGQPIGPEAPLTVASIIKDPTAVPPPVDRNYSQSVNVYLQAEEVTAEIEKGTSFTYWTYNGTVPGPFLRVRLNDTVVVHFFNDPTSTMNHSIDFHAATGPGGGGQVSQTLPGHWSNFSFRAMVPGLFVYHCASPNIPTHLAEGMYGLILVEPPQGLPKVDHEFYLMEGELYTVWPIHTPGNQLFNGTALLNEQPSYVVFNGAFNALTGSRMLNVQVNDTVRLFVGDGGPNVISSFHMIGAMFDTVYANGDVTDPPLHGLQTVLIAPGSAATLDFMAMYPAKYPLVDHALVNAIDKGAYALLNVTGWANSSIFQKLATPAAVAAPTPAPLRAARADN